MATNRVTKVILSVVVDVYTIHTYVFTYIYKDIQKEFICGKYIYIYHAYINICIQFSRLLSASPAISQRFGSQDPMAQGVVSWVRNLGP